jgi:tetratricopeptide (TPR) repeat protein
MSADTTSSSKRGMDCDRAAREEVFESYLADRLSEEDRAAFEEHYLGCARCFDELQTLQAIREELRSHGAEFEGNAARTVPRWAPAAGLAAAVVLAAAATLWMRAPVPSGVPKETAAPLQSEPESPRRPQPQESERAAVSEPSLEQLARIQPPPYQPLRLRGVPDEATERFQRGMERYREADYAGAVAELRGAAELDPEASHIRFFLGICHLMVGEDDAGIERLRATIGLGDSPYLEEAHLNLAKALLRRKDFGAAEAQLKALIQLRGSKSAEAGRLLTQIQELKKSSD